LTEKPNGNSVQTITESDDKNMDADEVESENQSNRWKEGSKTNGYHSINGSDQCRFSEFLNYEKHNFTNL
jgi:hypothetical protein